MAQAPEEITIKIKADTAEFERDVDAASARFRWYNFIPRPVLILLLASMAANLACAVALIIEVFYRLRK